jgi:hypothetical protein
MVARKNDVVVEDVRLIQGMNCGDRLRSLEIVRGSESAAALTV